MLSINRCLLVQNAPLCLHVEPCCQGTRISRAALGAASVAMSSVSHVAVSTLLVFDVVQYRVCHVCLWITVVFPKVFYPLHAAVLILWM